MLNYVLTNSKKRDNMETTGNDFLERIKKIQTPVNDALEKYFNGSLDNSALKLSENEVKKTQQMLNDGGFTDWKGKKLAVDGVRGKRFEDSFNKYMQSTVYDPKVETLQRALNVNGFRDKNGNQLLTDGKYGPKTDSAVMAAAEEYRNTLNTLANDKGVEVDDGATTTYYVSENGNKYTKSVDNNNRSHYDNYTNVPLWMDWDRNGNVDSADDYRDFDKNRDYIADWAADEKGRLYSDDEVRLHRIESLSENRNILDVVPKKSPNGTKLCWANAIATAVGYLGFDVTPNQIAINRYGAEKFNQGGKTTGVMREEIVKNGYLNGTNFEVGVVKGGGAMKFSDIKNDIDNGLPIIAAYDNHSVVIDGYADGATPETSVVYIIDNGARKFCLYGELVDNKWSQGYIRFKKKE